MTSRSFAKLLALATIAVVVAGHAVAQAGTTSVTFNVNSTTSVINLVGSVRGDFFGTGFISTIPLTAQTPITPGENGGNAQYQGTINADIGFNAATTTATNIKATGADLQALPKGLWLPGQWDGTMFNGSEIAAYGLAVSTLVKAAVRDLVFDVRSVTGSAAALSGNNFTSNFGLEFKSGFNDLDADALGTVDRQILRDEADSYEINTSLLQPNGMPYTNGIVWRNVTGTDGNGNPVFDMTPAGLANEFSSAFDEAVGASDPVRLFDASGNEIPALFANSPTTSSLTVTPTGGGNVNLGLALNIGAVGSFFLGDFLVSLNFSGTVNATGTAAFVEAPPDLVGDANGDCQVGAADYAIWAAQFGQTGANLSADFDNSGSVGAGDYTLWAANFGNTCPPGGAASVPEPSSLLLGLIGLGFVGFVARRRKA